VDAQAALSELTAVSPQVEAAAVLDTGGAVAAAIPAERGEALARAAAELEEAAADLRPGGPALKRLEVRMRAGSVFLVREGGRRIVATTAPAPTSGLVVYDLITCLRRLAEAPSASVPSSGEGAPDESEGEEKGREDA
jgi:predicted regulator of Ras-like GTPase activity (Roadblock/LC7/MglB family)